MNTKYYLKNGDILEYTVDVQPVTTMFPSLDKDWRYVDIQGHEHYYDNGYPTLNIIVDHEYWCSCCDDVQQDIHYECMRCDEVIKPGTVGPGTFMVKGSHQYYLNGEPITDEHANTIVKEYNEQIRT